jgi:hypothetical protein
MEGAALSGRAVAEKLSVHLAKKQNIELTV